MRQEGGEGVGEHHVRLQQLLHLLHVPYVRGGALPGRRSSWTKSAAWWPRGTRTSPLPGQNVNSYGKDLTSPWTSPTCSRPPRDPWDFPARFMTSHPKDASQKLFDTMASSPKIAPCFHLPLPGGERPDSEGHEPGGTTGRATWTRCAACARPSPTW